MLLYIPGSDYFKVKEVFQKHNKMVALRAREYVCVREQECDVCAFMAM